MKKIISTVFLFFIAAGSIFAQNKTHATVEEIKQKQKEAQAALDKLSPEQKKMMDQMGFSSKAASLPAGISDAQVTLAVGGGMPKRNKAFIDAIPKITLTAATVPAYIKTLNEYVEKGVAGDARSFAQQVYSSFKANKYDAASIGNASLGFWATGNPEIAVYMMGRACADDASDADLLGNFAAMLSMGGAPHRAIPLLEYLNKLYPGNTTILNNLGQAWFYLGETDKADASLKQAVRAFAYHPQANYTQCLIQESKGNKAGAIESMKNSLRYSYSLDKINKLRKLGYSVKGKDMRKPFRSDPDPLGLRKFMRPEVPVSYDQEIRLSADWDEFQKQVNEKATALAKELIPYQQAGVQQAQQLYNQYNKGGVKAMTANAPQTENIYRKVAEKNLEEMNKDGGASFRLKAAKKQCDDLMKDFIAKDQTRRQGLEKQYNITADKETELAKKGENIGYDNCAVQQKYSEWVYTNYNKPLEEAYTNYLHQLYLKITEELYWEQFTQEAQAFEATKIIAKKEWLAALGNSRYFATNRYGNCEVGENKGSRYKLADFDDMHCAYQSTLDAKVCTMTFECGKSSISFDAGRLNGKFNFKFDDAGKSRFVNGNLEATVIDKKVSAGKGPLQVGASVKAGMGMEFSSRGIEDVYATGEAKVTAGSDTVDDPAGVVNDPGVNVITISGRMSLISGNMTGAISGFGK